MSAPGSAASTAGDAGFPLCNSKGSGRQRVRAAAGLRGRGYDRGGELRPACGLRRRRSSGLAAVLVPAGTTVRASITARSLTPVQPAAVLWA